MQGNELFIQENEVFNGIVICKEIVLSICKDMSYSCEETVFSYKEMSCSYESFIQIVQRNRVIHTKKWLVYKEICYSYTQKWVVHIKSFIQGNKPFIHGSGFFIQEKECFRNELFVYMGVVD